MMDIRQRDIHGWAEATFTHDQLGIAAHILSEAAELYYACGGGFRSASDITIQASFKTTSEEKIPEETADVVILAFTMAGFKGFNLSDEIDAKMERNRLRKWGKPNAQGFTEHLEATA